MFQLSLASVQRDNMEVRWIMMRAFETAHHLCHLCSSTVLTKKH